MRNCFRFPSSYFSDGKRRIDFVLVYEPDSENEVADEDEVLCFIKILDCVVFIHGQGGGGQKIKNEGQILPRGDPW